MTLAVHIAGASLSTASLRTWRISSRTTDQYPSAQQIAWHAAQVKGFFCQR